MRNTLAALTLAATTAIVPAAHAEDLVFGTGNVVLHPINQLVMIPWSEKVNASANGALEIKPRHGQMLVNSSNYVERVEDGVIQIAWGMLVFNPGRFPKSLVSTVPFIEGDAAAGAVAFCSLYEQGFFDEEFEGLKPLFFLAFPQSSAHVNGGPLNSLEDLDGKKIMVGSPTAAEIVSAYGGTPLSTKLPDHYQSLQRGTADGNFMTFTAFPAFNLFEVTSHHLKVPLGGATGMVFMDQERYDALSDDAKAVLDANSGCETTREMGEVVVQWEADGEAFVAEQGHTITTISDEDFAKIRADLAPRVFQAFADRVEGGKELLDAYAAAMEAASASN